MSCGVFAARALWALARAVSTTGTADPALPFRLEQRLEGCRALLAWQMWHLEADVCVAPA